MFPGCGVCNDGLLRKHHIYAAVDKASTGLAIYDNTRGDRLVKNKNRQAPSLLCQHSDRQCIYMHLLYCLPLLYLVLHELPRRCQSQFKRRRLRARHGGTSREAGQRQPSPVGKCSPSERSRKLQATTSESLKERTTRSQGTRYASASPFLFRPRFHFIPHSTYLTFILTAYRTVQYTTAVLGSLV